MSTAAPTHLIDAELLDVLACPRDHGPLSFVDGALRCPGGHQYPVIDGVPVMLLAEVDQTHDAANRSLRIAEGVEAAPTTPEEQKIHPYVQRAVASTNGFLYRDLIGRLVEYPIPELRVAEGSGARFLDIGCNWGRWTVSAAQKEYVAYGIDPNIEAVLAARQVADQLGVNCHFVVGDARTLPFKSEAFSCVFSYSVIQHFSKSDAYVTIAEIGRVAGRRATMLVQMPNRFGVRSLYHQVRRGFHEGQDFDVRYWSLHELRNAFDPLDGNLVIEVDGFLGLGIQPSDANLMDRTGRVVIRSSETLRRVARRVPALIHIADSVYVRISRNAEVVEE